MENVEKLKNFKMPKGGGRAGAGLGALLGAAGLGIYTLSNCLFNVEGGHRAIVFNRVVGIKNDVSGELEFRGECSVPLALSFPCGLLFLKLFPFVLACFWLCVCLGRFTRKGLTSWCLGSRGPSFTT